jgi:hypothetical protein
VFPKFEALIDPYCTRLFLDEILGRSALHVTGNVDRLSPIASWSTLNDLLSFGGLSNPRLRLFKLGAEVPDTSISEAVSPTRPRSWFVSLQAPYAVVLRWR